MSEMERDALVAENQEIWNQFIERHQATVRGFSLPPVPENANNAIVIIEPRCHPHLEFVLRNALYFLGRDWGVNIFAGKKNHNFVNEITSDLGAVTIHSLDVENLTADRYNSIKKSAWFWRSLCAENILWLEPDCLIRRQGIETFMDYDYVGAPWHDKWAISPSCKVGNGGLSFRKRSAMLRIAENANPDNDLILTEDVFFVANMHMCNRVFPGTFRLPDLETAKTFSVEAVFSPDPFGLHKTWRYLRPKRVRKLISTIRY